MSTEPFALKEALTGFQHPLPPLARAAVRAILYFDLFRYPLRLEEIHRSMECKAGISQVKEALDDMVEKGWIEKPDGFYGMPGAAGLVGRRLAGNKLAADKMTQARKSAKRIAGFPFVEAVMVSGSLSKHFMEEGSDIDFFIVTRPERLWVARTMLVLYKKVFLLNSHKHFCVNYFVDTLHLEIEDKNIFTATETVFLLPMVNRDLYARFREANAWADAFFPNFGWMDTSESENARRGPLKRGSEWLLSGKGGGWLDAWCMKRTFSHWKRKFSNLAEDHFEVALRTRKYVSKHHPGNYQLLVMSRLEEKISVFEALHGVSLRQESIETVS